jgi:four helix bundle protein
MRIFEYSKRWPADERYSLTDQIRRSSRAVCANISEAWRKRRYERHFISKLSDADAEAAETRTWLRFAHRCGYLDPSDFDHLNQTYDQICGGLVSMMRNPDPWCGPSRLTREPDVDYTLDS